MDPPLGALPGLVWDAERQRYFRPKRPVAVATVSEGGCEVDVAARPVDEAVARRLKRRKRGDGVCAVCLELLGRLELFAGLLEPSFGAFSSHLLAVGT